jgi:anaerobic magnesium-protoporphyrin IX monomethyl ester cyclase
MTAGALSFILQLKFFRMMLPPASPVFRKNSATPFTKGQTVAMKLLLATLHSKQTHAALALPCLAAACSRIDGLTIELAEHTINERMEAILPRLVAAEADIIAFSCYIWNIEPTLKLAADLKLINPACFIIFGGPEASYGSHELMAANACIDCIVRGEGEETFGELLQLLTTTADRALFEEQLAGICGITFRSGDAVVTAPERRAIGNLDTIPSPFAADLVMTSKPLVYVETSRGCPFSCAFCISSLESSVRTFSFARVTSDLEILMKRGVETIKLVDRTFNYDAARAGLLWEFILENNRKSRFHFEIAADLLTDANIALLRRVPPDTFRFEIGVQSAAAGTLASVGRKSDLEKLFANVARLRRETAVTLHLDLVAGLPGEDLSGFVRSLGLLLSAKAHHIQVEPLKVLKGTAMRKIAREQGYSFSPSPPYRILKNPWLSFNDICRIDAAARALDLFYNSGRFATTLGLLASRVSLAELFTDPALEGILAEGGGSKAAAVFTAFYRLLEKALPQEQLAEAVDTLRFDFFLAGYPGNVLPPFLADAAARERTKPPLSHPEIARRLAIPGGCRIRTITARFLCDYSGTLSSARGCLTTFVYFNTTEGESVRMFSTPLA